MSESDPKQQPVDAANEYEQPLVEDLESVDGPAVTAAGGSPSG